MYSKANPEAAVQELIWKPLPAVVEAFKYAQVTTCLVFKDTPAWKPKLVTGNGKF